MKNMFLGNEVSAYGLANGYVDYATLAKSFNAVLSNGVMESLINSGYDFELVNGSEVYYMDSNEKEYTEEERDEVVEDLELRLEDEDLSDEEREEIESDLDCLNEEHYRESEVFQTYHISSSGANILEEYTDELVWYCEELDMYFWGVTHYGTSWDYVLTDIKL